MQLQLRRSATGAFPGTIIAPATIGLTFGLLNPGGRLGFADPLLLALLAGIMLRALIGERWRFGQGSEAAARLLLLPGIAFYALKNLNFGTAARLQGNFSFLLMMTVLAYFAVVLLLGRLLGQKRSITALVATGSAVCGASAIAMIAPSAEAETDDISVSLLAVALAAFLGLFVILPFLGLVLSLDPWNYAFLAGASLQFTGFVKSAVDFMPFLGAASEPALAEFALSVKALRYFALLAAIPFFASLGRGRPRWPLGLWLFLGGGLAGTLVFHGNPAFYRDVLSPAVRPVYQVLWASAMAAIGLGADVRKLLGSQGCKALLMSLGGFSAALTVLCFGVWCL